MNSGHGRSLSTCLTKTYSFVHATRESRHSVTRGLCVGLTRQRVTGNDFTIETNLYSTHHQIFPYESWNARLEPVLTVGRSTRGNVLLGFRVGIVSVPN